MLKQKEIGRLRVLGQVRAKRSVADSVICSGWRRGWMRGVERSYRETAKVLVLCMLSLAL